MDSIIKVWRYGVTVRGIKNRCRKVDIHINKFDLAEDLEPSEEKAKSLARAWLAANMKTVVKAQATATMFKVENQMETWEMFNDLHNLKWEIV